MLLEEQLGTGYKNSSLPFQSISGRLKSQGAWRVTALGSTYSAYKHLGFFSPQFENHASFLQADFITEALIHTTETSNINREDF